MNKSCWILLSGVLGLTLATGWAQEGKSGYPPKLDGAKVEVYKKASGVDLKLYIFNPAGLAATDKRAAIVFFFGGGWTSGSPSQFEHQCRYLASRGMVAITADYRVQSRNDVKVVECVRDAKSAIRWVRQNAGRLGIDPNRIAAGGGSAGGHLAAAVGLVPGLDEPGENPAVSSRPNAMVLFNPAVILAPVSGMETLEKQEQKKHSDMAARTGIDPARISPYHHIVKGAPPAIIFHGKADTTVPYATVELFAKKMTEMGNRCELAGFDGQKHGFFNYGRSEGNKYYDAALKKTDEFLVSLGYLKPAKP
ncbi:MAG: alpha/beta hydrolase [Acidobacteria bacterium]|nr:alpha/beta hydrolase [Acidobacteriota bacterium]